MLAGWHSGFESQNLRLDKGIRTKEGFQTDANKIALSANQIATRRLTVRDRLARQHQFLSIGLVVGGLC